MILKDEAFRIYAMPYKLRPAELAKIPEKDRWIVKEYIFKIGKQKQIAQSRRNSELAGLT